MKQTIVALSEYQQAASSCHTTPLSTHVITQYWQTLSDQIVTNSIVKWDFAVCGFRLVGPILSRLYDQNTKLGILWLLLLLLLLLWFILFHFAKYYCIINNYFNYSCEYITNSNTTLTAAVNVSIVVRLLKFTYADSIQQVTTCCRVDRWQSAGTRPACTRNPPCTRRSRSRYN